MGTLLLTSVTGFVGGEVSVREVGEQRVASFSVAVNRKTSSGEQQTLWVRVNCWNKLADVANGYLKTGSLVQIQASWMRPSAYLDREGNPQFIGENAIGHTPMGSDIAAPRRKGASRRQRTACQYALSVKAVEALRSLRPPPLPTSMTSPVGSTTSIDSTRSLVWP